MEGCRHRERGQQRWHHWRGRGRHRWRAVAVAVDTERDKEREAEKGMVRMMVVMLRTRKPHAGSFA
jgi:hypothetical protein